MCDGGDEESEWAGISAEPRSYLKKLEKASKSWCKFVAGRNGSSLRSCQCKGPSASVNQGPYHANDGLHSTCFADVPKITVMIEINGFNTRMSSCDGFKYNDCSKKREC